MIINQEVSFIQQNNLFEHIELCGKNAYKSEKSIKEGSSNLFIKRILASKHHSVLEHGSLYIVIDPSKAEGYAKCYDIIEFFSTNPYSKIYLDDNKENQKYYITTNLRVAIENNILIDIKNYILNGSKLGKYIKVLEVPTKKHELRFTFRIITDQKIAQEIVRHRQGSYTIESTRWINYKNKPLSFINIKNHLKSRISQLIYKTMTFLSEKAYVLLINLHERPEIARSLLLNGTKADVIMTMDESQWNAFFKLRMAKDAHPLINEVASEIYETIKNIKTGMQ